MRCYSEGMQKLSTREGSTKCQGNWKKLKTTLIWEGKNKFMKMVESETALKKWIEF